MSRRLPEWFKRPFPDAGAMAVQKDILNSLELHSICESALCPNIGECFSRRTATFLILGDVCTRHCSFCAVKKGQPGPVDEQETANLLRAVEAMGLGYVVITSVTRDDIPDGGAFHFARAIEALRSRIRDIAVEVLVPDFLGSPESIGVVVEAGPQVISHNLETVPRLYTEVRSGAEYDRSVNLLFAVRKLNAETVTKSGLMLGLGETREEVVQVMKDLREADCQLLTIGQYLRPSIKHHDVVRFVHPDEFREYEEMGKRMGFAGVAAAPLVRSSYRAAELFGAGRKKSGSLAGAGVEQKCTW